jgi:hypothetical protein
LRPETVLFVDDNHGNRAEAEEYVPGLRAVPETAIPNLRTNPDLQGKDDHELTRLQQYKVLEQKQKDMASGGSDNKMFLRGSRIRITFEYDIESNIDRAIELINRTNQLNFTKARLPQNIEAARAELRNQLRNFDCRAALVHVVDKYGDYGFCGFYLYRGHWEQRFVTHFAFSCRTLGMGVEQWVYSRIGKPQINVVGEVISSLDDDGDVDWINTGDASIGDQDSSLAYPDFVRIRGGCELEVLDQFFGVKTATTYSEVVCQSRIFVIPRNNIAYLRLGLENREQIEPDLRAMSLTDTEVETSFLDPCPPKSLLIFSGSGDVGCPMYRHKATGLRLPVYAGEFGKITDRTEIEIQAYFDKMNLDKSDRTLFRSGAEVLSQNFDLDLTFEKDGVREEYSKVFPLLPVDSLTIFVLPNSKLVNSEGRTCDRPEQRALNAWMKGAVKSYDNVRCVDMAEILLSDSEVLDWFHHFQRQVYRRVFEEILKIYNAWLGSACATRLTADHRAYESGVTGVGD